jgi:hypothetical protein
VLDGAVYREPARAPIVRARLDNLAAKPYGNIVASAGLLAAKAARSDDRSSSSGAPGDLGHLQPGRLLGCAGSLVAGAAIETLKASSRHTIVDADLVVVVGKIRISLRH